MIGFQQYITGKSEETDFVKDDDIYSIGNRNDKLYQKIIETLRTKGKLLTKEEIIGFAELVRDIYMRKPVQTEIPDF
ncbi:hypothetical protein DRJ17_02715 [Candidatus Woesearchaeota archaeon]|nr:MAG: hypothetical protein DRJ17_02715 [Candidatus Woesearchaeota archaeon]